MLSTLLSPAVAVVDVGLAAVAAVADIGRQ
jgi:hypothetical protein